MKKANIATTASENKQQSEKKKLTNKQILIEIVLFMGLAISVYLFCALISFDPADPGWSQTAWHEPIRNWGGTIGAYWSDILLQFFGFVAYSIPILMVLFCTQGIIYFYYRDDKPVDYFSVSLRIIGALAFLFSVTGFFSLNIQDLVQFRAGGLLGDIVAGEVLPLLGLIGGSIALLAISLICITLLTGFSWFLITEMIGIAVVFIATLMFNSIIRLFNKRSKPITAKNDLKEEHRQDEPTLNIRHSNDDIDNDLQSTDLQNPKNNDDEYRITVEQSNEQQQDHSDRDPLVELIPPSSVVSDQEDAELNSTIKMDSALNDEINTHGVSDIAVNHHPLNKEDEIWSTISIPKIDENNPPQPLPEHINQDRPHEFTINTDYYSPISCSSSIATSTSHDALAESTVTETNMVETIMTETTASENSILESAMVDAIALELSTMEIEETESELASSETTINKENIHHSLIHPLLQKDNTPLKKPTTPLPLLDLLARPSTKQIAIDHNALKATAALIEKSLSDFRVKARVVDYLPGPVITRFELELAPGVKASRISTLDRDLARSLSMSSVRVVEVIPGKPYVGLELPNQHRQTVYFREVLDSPQFVQASSPLTIVLGKDIAGQSVVADLAKMPHLLVAGTTGSGKSVGVNAMILSILYKSQPEDVRFIMIDPKMLELSVYEGIPHLLTDVVTDMKDAANALNWCINEMEKRYRLMSALGVRNIAGYNEKIKLAENMGRPIPDPLWRPGDSMDIEIPMLEKLSYIVVLVDEFADLIMAVGKKVEELIARLAQKARAAGIHLVLATQRPSVDVITGLIKANIPTRIAFTVSSKIDSRTILDQMGAESLLGMGDMLYLAPNSSIPIRVHGAFVRDEEVHAVVQDWKARGIPTHYIENITVSSDESDSGGFDDGEEELDPLFDQVVAFVIDKRRASISSVQRQFRIGYNRAARIVEQMETQGIVSSPSHNGNREVLAPPAGPDY